MQRMAFLASLLLLAACGDDDGSTPDAGRDAGPPPADGGIDAPACSDDAACDDGVYCNGAERCLAGACTGGDPIACDDGIGCTEDVCDEGERTCTARPPDEDGDGHGDASCSGAAGPLGDDCNDADPNVFPGAPEVCDFAGRDEDCDPSTIPMVDADRDGHIDARCCNGASCGDDCDDLVAAVHPGGAETCDRLDDDCDGRIDETVALDGFVDDDRDGHGDPASSLRACAGTLGWSADSDDCDDGDRTRHPDQVEVCDGRDNDCDGAVDEVMTFVVWYRDADGDGYGAVGAGTRISCTPPAGYALVPGDCADADPMRSPGAAERCNAEDDDCNGLADFAIDTNDGEDDDRDGHADAACRPTAGDDCDDEDPATRGALPEICDGRDNDCDGTIDEDAAPVDWFADADGDGFGSGMALSSCTPPPGRVLRAGDCDDGDPTRSPGAADLCNMRDDDCAGGADEDIDLSIDPEHCGGCEIRCASDEACMAGACVAPMRPCGGDAECDDGRVCTLDQCLAGRCMNRPVGEGAPCAGGACHAGACCTGCWDGATCRVGDEIDACGRTGMSCAVCADALACTTESCTAGRTCSPPSISSGCLIGGACVAEGTINPANECEECRSATSTTAWSTRDGGSCLSARGFPGRCQGTPSVCCDGCWDGSSCAVGTSPLACGAAGNACVACGCESDACTAGACAPGGARVTGLSAGGNRGTPSAFACATRSDGTLWCWGENEAGTLGTGDMMDRRSPTQVGTATSWASVSAGTAHACATRSDGSLWCWGTNYQGQLGLGEPGGAPNRLSPMRVGLATDWLQVAAGGDGTVFLGGNNCARRGAGAAGSLWCWGDNQHGENGVGDAVRNESPERAGTASDWTLVSVNSGGRSAGGDGFACGLRTGTLWCWGDNSQGQLGTGGMVSTQTPTRVGTGTDWSTVDAGGEFACGIRSGQLFCWGRNDVSQLGLGDVASRTSPARVGTAADWQSVSAHYLHACAIKTDGSLWCWGNNDGGELGVGDTVRRSTPTRVGTDTDWALVTGAQGTTSFAAFTCAAKTDGTLWCWGDNAHGNLGVGDMIGRRAPTRVCFP